MALLNFDGLKDRFRHLRQHSFVRRAVIFQVANGAGSVLQSVAGIVIARILQPELFGTYALAFSVASVASIVLATGIQDALVPVIARSHAQGSADDVRIGFGYWAKWIGISALFVAITVILLPFITAHLYGGAAIGGFAAVILVASFVSSSLLSIVQVAAQVTNRIMTLSLLTLADLITRYGAAVLFTLFGLGVLGASAGHLAGAILMTIIAWPVLTWLRRRDTLLPDVRSIIATTRTIPLRLHLSQSLWVWVDRQFGMLYQALPVAMIGLAVPVTQVAFFKLAFGYLNTALALLGPLSVLLNTEFAKIQVTSPKRMRSSFVKISLGGALVATVLMAGAALVGYWVFVLLYGKVYLPSVPLVYGLVAYGIIFGLGIGLGPMWRVLGKVKISVAINTCVLVIGVPLGMVLIRSYGLWGGVGMVTLWYAVAHIVSFFYLLRALKKHENLIP